MTVNGAPGAELTILFEPVAGGRTSMGQTDAEGHYELNFNATKMGALVGDHIVRVERTLKQSSQVAVRVEGQGAVVDKDSMAAIAAEQMKALKRSPIPLHYGEESTLRATVKKGSNNLDFDLSF